MHLMDEFAYTIYISLALSLYNFIFYIHIFISNPEIQNIITLEILHEPLITSLTILPINFPQDLA